jgi:hypothetical protein
MSIIANKIRAKRIVAAAPGPTADGVNSITINSSLFGPDGTGNVDVGRLTGTVELNGNTILPALLTGSVDLGHLATVYSDSGVNITPTWAQAVSALGDYESLGNIIAKNQFTATIGGDIAGPSTSYTFILRGIYLREGNMVVQTTGQDITDNTCRQATFTAANINRIQINKFRLDCITFAGGYFVGYTSLNDINFNTGTGYAPAAYISCTTASAIEVESCTFPTTIPESTALISTTRGDVVIGSTVALPTPVPNKKYIKIAGKGRVLIRSAWAIDASNIDDTGGCGTVIVNGKQIIPTF